MIDERSRSAADARHNRKNLWNELLKFVGPQAEKTTKDVCQFWGALDEKCSAQNMSDFCTT